MSKNNSQTSPMPTFANLANLSREKLEHLESALAFVLASPAAQDTYAQLIDGRRTWQSYTDPQTRGFCYEATPSSDHPTPSHEAMQQYEEIRRGLTLQSYIVDVKLAQQYENAPLDTRQHDIRLLEITAASLNALAGGVYFACHPEVKLQPQPRSNEEEDADPYFYRTNQPYVDFYHTDYQAFRRYPFGLLNVVGYWVETKLFGGVVLFDRGESGLEISDAFIHPQHVTWAYQISPRQIADFSSRSRSGNVGQASIAGYPLPFTQEADALKVDTRIARPGEAPPRIYKNDYDRQPVSIVPYRPHCCEVLDNSLPCGIDEALRIIKEKGWHKLDRHTMPHMSCQTTQSDPEDACFKEDDADGLTELERMTLLASGKTGALG